MTNPTELLSAAEAVIADRSKHGDLYAVHGSVSRWEAFVAAVTATRNAPAIPTALDWTKPIEALDWDGNWRAAKVADPPEQDDPTYGVILVGGDYRHVCADGSPASMHENPDIVVRNTCTPQPPADTVTIKRMTMQEWQAWHRGRTSPWTAATVLDDLGLIKPDPDPYQEHLSKHGLTDTVEARAMFDSFQEEGK